VERRPRIGEGPGIDARPTIAQAAPLPDLFDRPAVQAISHEAATSSPEAVPAAQIDDTPHANFVPGLRPAPAARAQLEPRPVLIPRPPARPSRDHGPGPASAIPSPTAVEPPPGLARHGGPVEDAQGDHGATGPQLRRFIKSRAYVPMHELRRRFGINGHDDEVTPVDLEQQRVFVGLPDREGRLLAELLRGGDIGYELSMDPITPIVVGVYPMRPVTRP
jgi:hypothetical protein